jgi:dipeptidyl aminopeptidase/acylaminoacyl peptidase
MHKSLKPGSNLLLLWVALYSVTCGCAADRIPVDAFFQNSEIASPAVSPDGRHVVFLSPVKDKMSVILFDLTTGKVEPIARAFDGDITEIFWKGDDRIVFSADPNGRESRAIMVVKVSTKSIQFLAENFRENRPGAAFASLVDHLPFDATHILVYGRAAADSWHEGLFTINLLTAERNRIYGDDPETSHWAADGNGEVRYRTRQDGDRTIHEGRADRSNSWIPIAECGGGIGADNSPVRYHGFSADNHTIYLTKADDEGRDALYAYDPKARQWGAPLFQSELGGIAAVRLSWDHSRLEGVDYGPDGRKEKWFDPRLTKIAGILRAAFPAKFAVTILSSDRNENVFTVVVHGDLNPGEYYLLDLRGKAQFVLLGKKYSRVSSDQLQPMTPIEYRARDGLLIHGFLTLPAGAAGKRVPLIIHPHGGPYGIRDTWGYDPEVQFLANRGYAVLQPNYRGSGGYGEAFLLAGRHEWGRKMQDDLTDAVKWAVDQGIADPARVCIYGASYGGYAALAGAVFTPDLYRCAVNYVGVSDMTLISNWQHEESEEGKAFYRDMVGDDKKILDSISPVNFVSRIKIPTLHAYGENDPRVDIKNWHELERELKKYQKTYEYIHEDNEGHGFRSEQASINFHLHLEAFLDRYLAPATLLAEPVTAR